MKHRQQGFGGLTMRPSAALFVIFLAVGAHGGTYYVSTSGWDGDDGSAGTPWETLQHAADSVSAGDTVLVTDGTYAGCTVSVSGTAGNPVTFRAVGGGVVVNSVGNWRGDNICVVADYVVIERFISEGADRAGFSFLPPEDGANESHGCVIRDCLARNNGRWGIFTGFTEGILIENNECCGSGEEHGIYVSCTSDNPVIRGNFSHDNTGSGIQVNGANTGWGDHIISYAVLEENVVCRNGWKGLSIIGTSDSVIRNNLIYENGPAAGGIHFAPQNGMQSQNNVVVNNTVIEPNMTAVRLSNASSGTKIFNNVLVSSSRAIAVEDSWSFSGFESDYNVLCGTFVWEFEYPDFAGWQALGHDAHSEQVASAGEVCTAPAVDDYHLFALSPAVDLGVASFGGGSAAGVDLDGGVRPAGSGYDAGCYEYGAEPPVDNEPPQAALYEWRLDGTVWDDTATPQEVLVDGSAVPVAAGSWTSGWLLTESGVAVIVEAQDASGNVTTASVSASY